MREDPSSDLPAHVEDAIEAMTSLRHEHLRSTSPYQRSITAITGRFGRPAFITLITIFIACWIAANVLLGALHHVQFDPPPFYWLQGLVTTTALYVTVLILTAQRHENALAEQRAQLTLQIALVTERKLAKLIERTEQHRRDDPSVETQEDAEAVEMSSPVNATAVASALKAAESDTARTGGVLPPA